MAKDKTAEIAKIEGEKINKQAEINEAYFVGLLWADPFTHYSEYKDTISQDEFIHPIWGFFFDLGRRMYEEGIKTFDDITVHTKVKEYNIVDEFNKWGKMTQIDDAVSIVKDNIDNIDYYYETIKKNYVIKQLILLFGSKVLVNKGKYKWQDMTREQLTMFWSDKLNRIALDNVAKYEAENLYIDPDEFIRRLEEESAEMLPFYNSYLMNSITQGTARGHVMMFGGFGNTGKALALNTPIPTPNGWTTMRDLKVGDTVFGADGKPTTVVYKSPVFKDHDVYEVCFDDGEKILADAEHQWSVETSYSRRLAKKGVKEINGKFLNSNGYFTLTTEEMKDDFVRKRSCGKEYKYKVPMHKPIEYEEKELLVNPYTLGLWLGDGTSSNGEITVGKLDLNNIINNIKNDGYDVSVRNGNEGAYTLLLRNHYNRVYCEYGHPKNEFWNYNINKCRECDRIRSNAKYRGCDISLEKNPKYYKSVLQQLRDLNLINNKHIPRIYLQSSLEQRYELLRGLMDSDGYVDENGYCEFSQKNKVLIDGFSELLSSLGIKHTIKERVNKLNSKKFKSYRVSFYASKENSCFNIERKHNRLKDKATLRRGYKSIVDIRKVETIPTQCIMVDNEDHLYLAGERMTVTHNSSIMAEKFVMSCIANKEKLIIVLNEEDAQSFRQKIVLSILFHEFSTGLDRKRMVNGKLQESDKEKIRKAFGRMHELMDGAEAQIKVIFMEKYVMSDLEKIVRFWANRGYINLLIDTHKVSDESKHDARWETFVEDMKTIYRLTRKNAGGCNLRTVVTFQLADNAIKNRYLDFEAIGEGKASKNEASVMMMFRAIWADEYEGGKRELECYKLKKKASGNGYDREEFKLKTGKTYYLMFTPKNRFGANNDNGQPVMVIEPQFNANHFKEVGWTFVANDKSGR